MTKDFNNKIISAAIEASQNSYSPYSKFKVGAAVITVDNQIYTGCNIENLSYGATICAERTAIVKAISNADNQFKAIAIYAENKEGKSEFAFPCGMCRQVLAEFCNSDLTVIIAKSQEEYIERTLGELLPDSFNTESLR